MKSFNQKKAFSLIELIMVIVIVGILVGTFAIYVSNAIKLWQFTSFRSETVSQARLGLSRMVREMRQVKDNTSVTTANGSDFKFTTADGSVIEFVCSTPNTPLLRILGATSNNLVQQITSTSIFTYYDASNNVLSTPTVTPTTNIKSIKIILNLQAGNQTNTLTTRVYPRNL